MAVVNSSPFEEGSSSEEDAAASTLRFSARREDSPMSLSPPSPPLGVVGWRVRSSLRTQEDFPVAPCSWGEWR